MSLSVRLKDLLGPVTGVKKNKESRDTHTMGAPPSPALPCHPEIGILLPNNQRQHRILRIQKDVLPYALC